MSNKTIAILRMAAIIVLIVSVFWFSFDGVWQCYEYHRFFGSKAAKLATLSYEPETLELSTSSAGDIISLGFAQVRLDYDSIRKIRFIEGTTNTIIEFDGWRLVFYDLRNVSEAFNEIPPEFVMEYKIAGRLVETFDSELRVARTLPKRYSQIFFMPSDEFREYKALCFLKTSNIFNANGVGIFETPDVQGVVGLGEKNSPGRLMASVYSKDSNLAGLILVNSDSPERSKEKLFSLLASYKFLVTEVRSVDELRKLVIGALQKYDKFELE